MSVKHPPINKTNIASFPGKQFFLLVIALSLHLNSDGFVLCVLMCKTAASNMSQSVKTVTTGTTTFKT